jgi:hypothetical protein
MAGRDELMELWLETVVVERVEKVDGDGDGGGEKVSGVRYGWMVSYLN